MKKILITGANSYIGTSFESYVKENHPNEYIVDTVDMLDSKWREKSFAEYDSVFHVAGIAHQKETKQNAHLYYEVNRDLAIETAKKAKADGVKQFIFLSSMSVYGMTTGVITKETIPNPKTHYGRSKLQAEEGLRTLSSSDFQIAILRPPMVYGKGCKGNFQSIIKIVKKLPVFPKIKNKRSMIYIDALSNFVVSCINNGWSGVYHPQNVDYVETQGIAKVAAEVLQKKIYFSYLLGMCVWILRFFLPIAKKAFGDLIYETPNTIVTDNIASIKNSIM